MRGVSIRQIPAGKPGEGTKVVRLHYLADPTMTAGRIAALKSQYTSEARWNREMEIDYGALGGQLVFPGFDEGIHVVPDRLPLDEKYNTVWLACDPHPRTAHAFVWLAVNREGELAVVWSWWPQERHEREGMVVKDYVEGLRAVENAKLFPASHIELMDVAGRSFNAEEEKSYFDKYREHGVYFNPAKKNRDLVGFDLINEALQPRPYTVGDKTEQRPLLTIMRGCGDNDELVWQMRFLRYREWKGIVTDKDAPEEPQQKDRHLVDCLSYILLDGPRFIDRRPAVSDFEPTYSSIGY
jgi:hypothetical protein